MMYLVYDAKDFPQSIDIRDIGTTKISVVSFSFMSVAR